MRVSFKPSLAESFHSSLKRYVTEEFPLAHEICLSLGGLKSVRILSYYPLSKDILEREFSLIKATIPGQCDATVYFWRESGASDLVKRLIGLDIKTEVPDDPRLEIFRDERLASSSGSVIPMATIGLGEGDGIYARFGNEYYFGLDGLGSGTWFKEGHLFVQALFRILNTGNSSLVHGACLGLDGKGVLMCARGGGGKSTLSVTAMLRGFEFVSDDYLILSENGGNVAASPIYSFITLSPEMYDALYDDFGEARFLGVSHWKGKYVFDISEYAGSFRSNYPVKAIMFPELCLDAAAPKVALCSPAERGRTITQIAHSTVSQMFIKGFRGDQRDPDFILKIVKALSGFDCYKITLSRDLDANVGCLREFISNL